MNETKIFKVILFVRSTIDKKENPFSVIEYKSMPYGKNKLKLIPPNASSYKIIDLNTIGHITNSISDCLKFNVYEAYVSDEKNIDEMCFKLIGMHNKKVTEMLKEMKNFSEVNKRLSSFKKFDKTKIRRENG